MSKILGPEVLEVVRAERARLRTLPEPPESADLSEMDRALEIRASNAANELAIPIRVHASQIVQEFLEARIAPFGNAKVGRRKTRGIWNLAPLNEKVYRIPPVDKSEEPGNGHTVFGFDVFQIDDEGIIRLLQNQFSTSLPKAMTVRENEFSTTLPNAMTVSRLGDAATNIQLVNYTYRTPDRQMAEATHMLSENKHIAIWNEFARQTALAHVSESLI